MGTCLLEISIEVIYSTYEFKYESEIHNQYKYRWIIHGNNDQHRISRGKGCDYVCIRVVRNEKKQKMISPFC
jgi:hypothetical protein